DEPGKWFEHLPDKSLRCPITHRDGSTGAAHPQQFARDQFRPWSKHGSKQAGHHVKAAIVKWQSFGVTFEETCAEAFCPRSRRGSFDQVRGDIDPRNIDAIASRP